MSIRESFIAELKHESALTKKMLEKVPMDKKDWKPHEKSMTIGRLATHIADNAKWASDIRNIDNFDFLKDYSFGTPVAEDSEHLLRIFQTNVDNAINDLSQMPDEDFEKMWTVSRGEQVIYSLPKKAGIRGFAISHMVHHRGQLSVYLRLLDIPVPGMYGPTADEQM
ncbi:MAG TPA: DinB family protein [Chitinophagaceae bacterium]|jgi:uncharacterized damage-inducible protein DinB|nr:DinB family protein [Chitinophagaceae bacterium]